MGKLSFLLQYILKPGTTGAILPSSKYLAHKMVEDVNFAQARCIVEYGPGTGVFTQKILESRHKDTLIILLEHNENFCTELHEKFKNEKNLHIINDSAENIGDHLKKNGFTHADYIISGLPFASLPYKISQNIMVQTKKFLNPGGFFITFQYTLFKKKIFTSHFLIEKIKREFRNVPPAHILIMKNHGDSVPAPPANFLKKV